MRSISGTYFSICVMFNITNIQKEKKNKQKGSKRPHWCPRKKKEEKKRKEKKRRTRRTNKDPERKQKAPKEPSLVPIPPAPTTDDEGGVGVNVRKERTN